jgi:hypothetical protein
MSEDVRGLHSSLGGILLDVRHGHMFRLNPVGSRIVELLEAGRSQSQIAIEISKQFVVDLDTVHRDLSEFLASLDQHHLTDVVESVERLS